MFEEGSICSLVASLLRDAQAQARVAWRSRAVGAVRLSSAAGANL
jgi:hypothetical protein